MALGALVHWSNLLASLGHTGRVVLGYTLNALWHVVTKRSYNVLCKFTILCWATFITILGCMWPNGPWVGHPCSKAFRSFYYSLLFNFESSKFSLFVRLNLKGFSKVSSWRASLWLSLISILGFSPMLGTEKPFSKCWKKESKKWWTHNLLEVTVATISNLLIKNRDNEETNSWSYNMNET